jgi:hypothetical protein
VRGHGRRLRGEGEEGQGCRGDRGASRGEGEWEWEALSLGMCEGLQQGIRKTIADPER